MDTIDGISVEHIKLLFSDDKYLDKYLDRIIFEVYEKASYNNIEEINERLKKLKITEYDLTSHLDSMKI